jgi:hypothetical protein
LAMLRQARDEPAQAKTISRRLMSAPMISVGWDEADMISPGTRLIGKWPARLSDAVVKPPVAQYTLMRAEGGCLRGVSLFLSAVRCANICRCFPNRRYRRQDGDMATLVCPQAADSPDRPSTPAPNECVEKHTSPEGAQRIPGKTVVASVPIPGMRCASSGLRTIVISASSVKVVPFHESYLSPFKLSFLGFCSAPEACVRGGVFPYTFLLTA